MRRAGMLVIVISALVVSLGCGGEKGQDGICPDPSAGGPVILFDLFSPTGEELAPFPTDLKTVADPVTPTGIRLAYERSMFREGLNAVDGFSVRSVLLAPVARAIDPASLPATPEASVAPGSSLFLLDIEGLSADEAGTLGSRKIPVETGWVEDGNSIYTPTIENAIAARPAAPLETEHRYALVITSCVSADDGSGLGTQQAFADLRDGGDAPAGASAAGVEDMAQVVDYLVREGYDRGDLSLVTTFTTQSVHDTLIGAREAFDAEDAPDPAVTDVIDAAVGGELNPDLLTRMPGVAALLAEYDITKYRFEAIDKVVFGTFDATSFLDGDEMLARDPATWDPIPAGTETVEFILTLPKEDAAAGIAPPYRVLVYQHALGVCKETIVAFADTMARFGIAVIGIDSVHHGFRNPDVPGGCELAFGDFFVIDNFSKTSAYFMQSVIDIWSVVKLLRDGTAIDVLPAPGGDGTPDLDVTRLAFAGQSMGSSMGIDALALEPAFGAGVVNVGGGNLIALLLSMGITLPDDPLPTLAEYSLQDMEMAAVVPVMGDSADPINWSDTLLSEPAIDDREAPLSLMYQQAAYDDMVPYEVFVDTSLAMSIPMVDTAPRPIAGLDTVSSPVQTNMSSGGTAAAYQFPTPAGHVFLIQCSDPAIMYAGQLQLAVFVDGYLRGDDPVVIDPLDDAEVTLHAPDWVWP